MRLVNWSLLLHGFPLAAFLLSSGCVPLYDMKVVSGGAEYWAPELEGHVRLNGGPLGGTNINVDDFLDDADSEETGNYFARLQLMNFTVEASYFQIDYTGDNVINRDITFGDQTFTIGENVHTELDMEYGSAKLKMGILGLGPVALGGIIGVNYLDLEAKLRSSIITGSQDIEVPIPIAGAIATFNQGFGDYWSLFGEAEITGISIDAYDIEGHFFDIIARVGIKFSIVKIGGGYRFIEVDIEDTDDDFTWDLSLGGPTAFVEIVF